MARIRANEIELDATGSVETPDTGKVKIYSKADGKFYYKGGDGIENSLKGDKGDQGIQGEQGIQGIQGEPGLDGADAVAGKLPSAYVDRHTPIGTTSATLEVVTGMETTITLEEAVEISVIASFEIATISGASASKIALAIEINGTIYDEYSRYLSGTDDAGIGSIVHRSNELPAGTYTVRLYFRRVEGVSTPGINSADMLVMAMQGAKGEQGIQGIQGEPGEGVPAGGTAGQRIAKVDGTDYNTGWVDNSASLVTVDTTNFNLNLSGTDTTVQTALETLDDLVAGGGGVTIYECTVGTTGADYATVGSAIADGKKRMLLVDDTVEASNITLPSGVIIHGLPGNEHTVTMGSYSFTTATVLGLDFRWFELSTSAPYCFNAVSITDGYFERINFTCPANTEDYWFYNVQLENVRFESCRSVTTEKNGFIHSTTAHELRVWINNHKHSTTGGNDADDFIFIDGLMTARLPRLAITNSYIKCARARFMYLDASSEYSVVSLDNTSIDHTSGNSSPMIEMDRGFLRVSGGSISSNDSALKVTADFSHAIFTGVQFETLDALIDGNSHTYKGHAIFDKCRFGGNVIDKIFETEASGGRHFAITITDPLLNEYDNRSRVQIRERKVEQFMIDDLGGANAMEAVTMGTATATEIPIKRADTADDPFFVGIVEENRANDQSVSVCTKGYVGLAKVDGTDDIAINDYLGTSTTAGVLKKTTTVGARVAIALGAYTNDDTNGTIPILLLGRAI